MKTSIEPESGIHTIRELIDHRAETQPEDVFLISPETGRTVTFRGLQEQAHALFGQLRQEELEPGDKIAFLMDNGLFPAELFLGAMYCGFVLVPLNVRAGTAQLSYTLDHCDAKVVFVAEKYSTLIKEVLAGVRREVRVIPADIDRLVTVRAAAATPAVPRAPAPEDVALLMYTSGSTGQPKAALHTHSTILAQARNSVVSHQLTAADRSLLVLPLYHINAECVTLIPTLLSGGSVVVPHHFIVSHFWDWIDEHHCTWSALVPTIISQLLDWKDPRAEQRGAAFKRIRFLRSSSAPLSPSLHREFLDKFKLPLFQAMGSTEAGNIFSNPVPPGESKIGSPGLPWGFEARIVNREGADLPAGEPGEVLLRGPAMMQGYYKDPVSTAAALDTEGWFHTGDLAYRDEDGYFFVVGRSKELIIKAGMNIAPKQIDEVLESHPSVLEAAAVGVSDRYVGEDLVAFVVLRDGQNCDEREMLSFCEERLGHFKTPTRIHFVDDLPKGPSGKVQRLRLVQEAARPEVARSVSLAGDSTPSEAAANGVTKGAVGTDLDVEEIIAEIWSELLSEPNIDATSNFFELGGHSLLAIQSLSRLRQKVPVLLSLTDFFENSTVSQQAALVRQRLASAPAEEDAPTGLSLDDSQPIPLRDRTSSCPLSPAQQRIWFVEQLAPRALAYNEAEAVRLVGDLRVDSLERAFNVIVGRHELLRSTIQVSNGEPSFVVHYNWPLKFKRIDLSSKSPAEKKAEVDRLLVSEPRQPYHLEKSPGIRTTIVRLGPKEHVFILMMHHIICDWSSEGVLWRELSSLYHALLHGEPLNLPPLPIQHGDYASWQQDQYAPANYAKDLAFWKETLRDAPELLELPADRARPASASYRGARKRVRVDSAQCEALRQLGRREKTSLFTIFAATLDVLLHRYTGRDDILLGIPLADRDRPELQSMIGFLLHTQVLRTAVEDGMSFSSLLGRVQKAALEMFTHRAVPFDLVVREVGQERNLSYSPLFQVMLNWRDREQELAFIGLEGLKIESLLAESRTAKFDLTLMVTDDGHDISLEMEYSTDLFDESRIVRMLDHYRTLLAAVAASPDTQIGDLPLLTEAERRQIVEEWNQTEVDYPKDRCLHDLIEEQVARTPEAVAVKFENRQLTYRELNAKANQLARHLQNLGVGPDTLVGICVERSLEMVIGLLGILKAGGAYVPLDPEYPKDRLAFMVEDAAVPVLLTQSRLVGTMPASAARLIQLDADWPAIAAESDAKVETATTAEHLAYMIYTSGSTGRPKGAMNTHQGIVNRLLWMQDEYRLTSADSVLQKTPFSFDVSVWEFFWPLLTGSRLVVARPGGHRDTAYLTQLIATEKITTLHFVPSMLQVFLEEEDLDVSCASVKRVICSGEALPMELQRRFFSLIDAELHNLYGPTEAAVDVTYWACERNSSMDTVPIGRPIANIQMYVLDARLRPVPIGLAGELHIGGIGLARGYHNRPELTAEKFIANPLSKDPKARLYKTGDLARFLPSGNIEYLGRLDHQVKIRGLRVELGEIEEALNRYPGVQTSIVLMREDTPGDKRLIAYLVTRDGAVNTADLRENLRVKLPDYMVPAAFVTLEELPLTPNGKLDRKALPRPDFEAIADTSNFEAPRTPTETVLVGIWCDVLGLKQVGIHDNFFELGGHSLLAVRLFTEIRKRFKINFGLSTLFEAPTIGALAALIGKAEEADSSQRNLASHGLVSIRSGTNTPLFVIHSFDGNVIHYEPLGRIFPEDHPIYAIEAPGLHGLPMDYSVEAMATRYIEQIRERQPHGPYFILGHCFGALITYEIARQLSAQNERMGMVGLLDIFHYNSMKGDDGSQAALQNYGNLTISRRLNNDIRSLIVGPDRLGCLWRIKTTLESRMSRIFYAAMYKLSSLFGWNMPLFLRDVKEATRIAANRYAPGTHDGTVVLFQCQSPIDTDPPDCSHIWQRLVKKGLIITIPGDHNSMLREPGVRDLADHIQKFMRAPAKSVPLSSGQRNGEAMVSREPEAVS